MRILYNSRNIINACTVTEDHKQVTNDRLRINACNSYSSLIKLLIISVLLGFYACITEASSAQNYSISDHKEKIHAFISSSKPNQISFEGMTITNVIGEDDKYQILPDDFNQNLFLVSHALAGEIIELSFNNSAGKIINMALYVKDVPGQMIFIKDAGEDGLFKKAKEEEIANLLRVMIRDKNIKSRYFISKKTRKLDLALNHSNTKTAFNNIGYLHKDDSINKKISKTRNNVSNQKNYEVIQDRTYSYKELLGARIIVSNKDKKMPLELCSADFENLFNQTLSVTIDQNVLPPKTEAYVYVIAKKREE